MVGALAFHLLPALLGGLLVYELVKRVCPYLDDKPNEASRTQAIVVGGIGASVVLSQASSRRLSTTLNSRMSWRDAVRYEIEREQPMKQFGMTLPLVAFGAIALAAVASLVGILPTPQLALGTGLVTGATVALVGLTLTMKTGAMSLNYLIIAGIWAVAGLMMPKLLAAVAADPAAIKMPWFPSLICSLVIVAACFTLHMCRKTVAKLCRASVAPA